MNDSKNLKFTAVFEEDPDGGFVVSIPTLPGCLSHGQTFEEAKKNIQEAVGLYLEVLKEKGEEAPEVSGETILATILAPMPA
jgi:predicted RNase H-like HicB family nuclease